MRCFDAQLREGRTCLPIAQFGPPPVPVLKGRSKQRWTLRKLTPQGALGSPDAAIDSGRSRRGSHIDLVTNVIKERGFSQCLRCDDPGVMSREPPAEEMKQVMGIAAQCSVGHAADPLFIEEAVDPTNLLV